MTTTTTPLITSAELPRVFEVFFFVNTEGGSLQDRLFAKANADYHRMFRFTGSVVHLAVRFGTHVYEVTEEGTVKYPWSVEFLDNARIVGFFTADISNYSADKRLAALFTLENCLGRKLDIKGSLSYLWQVVGFGKSEAYMTRVGVNAIQDQVKLPPATFKKTGRRECFHLPYTCASLANIVLNRLMDYEPGFTGHLAQSVAMTLSLFAECGFGGVYDLDTEDWIVGNG